MTPKERAAMQQALNVLAEASGLVSEYKGCHSRLIESVKSLREALADTRSSIRSPSEYSEQAEQEPVAWVNADNLDNLLNDRTTTIQGNRSFFRATPLYAAPVDAKAIREEALEEAAKVCDNIENDHWNLYKGRPPYTGSEAGRADPHEQGVSMGAGECAAAIRGLK